MIEKLKGTAFSLTLNGNPVPVFPGNAAPETSFSPLPEISGTMAIRPASKADAETMYELAQHLTWGGLTYGSVCSGIEAASVAWHPLGWKPAWFAEIEKYPAAVLAHHWPDVANLGDMTRIAARITAGEVTAPDVLVGGTPCQAFSVAGLRQSLKDPRGQLTLSYVELANAIDKQRTIEGHQPATIVWENVPGSLYTPDNAFGNFLAALAGEDEPFEPGPRPERGKNSAYWRWSKKTGLHIAKWPKSGCVYGRQRKLAWRILDAQYFGVPQRRRRIFVVASAAEGFDPAEILLEFDGVRRNSAPRREPGTAVAALTANGVGTCGADDNQGQAGHLIAAFGGGNCSGALDVAACLTAKGQRIDYEVETFAVEAYSSNGHASFSHGVNALRAKSGSDHESLAVMSVHGTQDPDTLEDLAHTLGRNQGQENGILTCRSTTEEMLPLCEQMASTLTVGCPDVVYALQDTTGREKAQNGKGWSDEGTSYTVDTVATQGVALSIALRGRDGGNTAELGDEIAACLRASTGGSDKPHIMHQLAVRRLTPTECERLQGFPDAHTLIPWKGKASELCPDAPRYKAIGNSMAVPVMRWIGDRIGRAVAQVQTATPDTTEKAATAFCGLHSERTRPFLKWAGGKFRVLDTIASWLPDGDRLVEPFVGAGSVFMNMAFPRYLLADVNPDLINLYRQMDTSPDTVIRTARQLVEGCASNEAYLALRDEFNGRKAHAIRHAALFLALNRTCFNGLSRYNEKGAFNVGWCKKDAPYFPTDELEAFAARRSPAREFICGSFEETIARAGAGDVIFCDPPYEPMPGKGGFTAYARGAFTFEHQQALATACVAAHQRGARVVITNSGAPLIRTLYLQHGFDVHTFTARRSISSDGSTRGDVSDLIAIL